jgi:hypothetical protein
MVLLIKNYNLLIDFNVLWRFLVVLPELARSPI